MENCLIAKNVRISFPQLWHDDVRLVQGKEQVYPKSATILLSKTEHAETLKSIKVLMNSVIASADPAVKKAVKQAGMAAFKGICLRGPGQDGWRESYPDDHQILKLNCKKGGKPPVVLHKDMTRATEADDPIYSGCRVNVKFQIWLQDNQWGRRINGKLITIQFAKDDEPLDASHISKEVAVADFEALPDTDNLKDGESIGTNNPNDTDGDLDFMT